MTNKTLFLLTKAYPFGMWEQYLTDEIECLSRVFDKIIIYPNDYFNKEAEHDKKLPANVEVLNFNQELKGKIRNSYSDYLYLFKHTTVEFLTTDDKRNFFKNFKWNLVNFWTQYQISKLFTNYLKENNYSKENAVFYSYWFNKSAIFLSILKSRGIIKSFLARAHSVDLYHQDWGMINKKIKVPAFKMFKFKYTEMIFPVSEYGTHYLKNKYPFLIPKVSTRYLGVIDRYEMKAKKQDSNDIFHIVTCSDIDYNKRLDHLADALMKVNHKVLWTHFGSGKLFDQLERKTALLAKNIQVNLKGRVPNKLVKQFYNDNKIDLFVNLSIVEGLPVSIMEAIMCEIPVVATRIYGTPEAVVNNKNGFLIDVNFTIDELASKINDCIENHNLIKEMGKASREIYLEKFDAGKNYMTFADYLASL